MESPVSLAVKEEAIVFHSEMSRIVWLHALDGFEDVLDLELQRSEVIVYPVSSEWTLLVVWEWFLLEGTTTLLSTEGLCVATLVLLRRHRG